MNTSIFAWQPECNFDSFPRFVRTSSHQSRRRRCSSAAVALWLCLAAVLSAANVPGAIVSAMKTGDDIVVESRGGALTYKAVLSSKAGGDITEVRLPAGGKVAARELNDIFYHGTHGDEYTLRGWTGKTKFIISCSMDVIARRTEEVTVKVKVAAMGTFKILTKDE